MAMEMSWDYRLRWLDFDRYGRIQPVTVLDLCQDVATMHAEQLGIGRDKMLERGAFWVVIRLKYEVVHEPEPLHTVRVRTWPHSLSTFSFNRDFAIYDEAGELLIKATSEWVLMDAQTRKFTRTDGAYDGPDDFCEDRAFPKKPRKIPAFDGENLEPYTVVPAFSDIDVNGHVNNARYPRFVVDALNPSENGAIRTFQIDYRHEVLPNAPLTVHTLVEPGKVLSKGVREDGQVAFACSLEIGDRTPN